MRIYTDGACRRGVGGWGWWNEETDQSGSGCEIPSTNQRMELWAAFDAVQSHILHAPMMTIVSDSAYLVNCFKDRWYVKWMRNGWFARNGEVANREIWEPLIDLVLNHGGIQFEWVKGHSGDVGNDRADELASAEVELGLSLRNMINDD